MGEKAPRSSIRTRPDLSRTASFDDPARLIDANDPEFGHEFVPRTLKDERLEARPYVEDELAQKRGESRRT